MVRVLIVLNDVTNPNLGQLQKVFTEFATQVCDPHVPLERIESIDPHCILSIGELPPATALWSMPLWRRRTWLNVPDSSVAPMALRQSLLSLLNSSIDPGVFADVPTVSLCTSTQVSEPALIHKSLSSQSYDNWEYLVHHVNALGDSLEHTLNSLALARDGLLWLSNGNMEAVPPTFLESMVSAWASNDSFGSIVVADQSQPQALLENLVAETNLDIRHVLIDRRAFYAAKVSAHRLPLKGLMGIIAAVLSSPSTKIIDEIPGLSFDRTMLSDKFNQTDVTLSHGPVQWAKWFLTSGTPAPLPV